MNALPPLNGTAYAVLVLGVLLGIGLVIVLVTWRGDCCCCCCLANNRRREQYEML